MPSLVIWDTRDDTIMASMIPGKGSAPLPSVERCFGNRPSLLPHLTSAWIAEAMTTVRAKGALRIVDGEPVLKPSASLSWAAGPGELEATLTLDVHDLLDGEEIDGLVAVLESDGLEPVEVEIDPGETVFEFDASGRYVLRMTDERLRPPHAVAEVDVE